ncbi:hypothetical protein CC78DRAFT_618539 [Lojkania enalia]|uniref:Uncharacterized protein n=1 Tax=Lojkania enalia TaxID=147567 RepID=A0A9P4N1L6_9PLEO|nr:hypothetical protein CC78DRAFT_618539 [Didymosphaeria enalia]
MNLSTLRPAFWSLAPSQYRIPTALSKPTQPLLKLASQSSPFSSTQNLQRRKKGKKVILDARITAIRYHLTHPLTPRPLRFSRTRFLRHWTIHRAWMLFLRKRRWAEERELERQYMSMRAACEALRLLDENGNAVPAEEAGAFGPDAGKLGPRGKEVGRLYRQAMTKKGIWEHGVPIEYARIQTDFPGREGWNHGWTR